MSSPLPLAARLALLDGGGKASSTNDVEDSTAESKTVPATTSTRGSSSRRKTITSPAKSAATNQHNLETAISASTSASATNATAPLKRKAAPVASTPRAAGSAPKKKGKGKKKGREKLLSVVPAPSEIPPSYGPIDDHMLVRRIYVQPEVFGNLKALKEAILLQGFEEQYTPDQIKLFGEGNYELSTDRVLKQSLSYDGGYEATAGRTADGRCCCVAGAINEEESELLVVPLQWPVSHDAMQAAACLPSKRINTVDAARIKILAEQPGLYSLLPPPVHIDDWSAKVREMEQTTADMHVERPPKLGTRDLCILPVVEGGGCGGDLSSMSNLPLPLAELKQYMEAFYDMPCKILDPVEITRGTTGGGGSVVNEDKSGRLYGARIGWRNYCDAAGKPMPHGQYRAGDILAALGGGMRRKSESGSKAAFKNAYAVLAVTMVDLYSGDDDLFVMGYATLYEPRRGVFSFARYDPMSDGFTAARLACSAAPPASAKGGGAKKGKGKGKGRKKKGAVLSQPLSPEEQAAANNATFLSRACKTAVHEMGHMCGIGHCVHAYCCMNGSGHLREDFAIPHHLCPVCLSKVKHVFGSEMDLARRAAKLHDFFSSNLGFEREAKWVEKATAGWKEQVGSGGSGGGGGSAGAAGAAT